MMNDKLPKYKMFCIPPVSPRTQQHIGFIGCVCEFADECDMTLKEFLDGKKCKASYYPQK